MWENNSPPKKNVVRILHVEPPLGFAAKKKKALQGFVKGLLGLSWRKTKKICLSFKSFRREKEEDFLAHKLEQRILDNLLFVLETQHFKNQEDPYETQNKSKPEDFDCN